MRTAGVGIGQSACRAGTDFTVGSIVASRPVRDATFPAALAYSPPRERDCDLAAPLRNGCPHEEPATAFGRGGLFFFVFSAGGDSPSQGVGRHFLECRPELGGVRTRDRHPWQTKPALRSEQLHRSTDLRAMRSEINKRSLGPGPPSASAAGRSSREHAESSASRRRMGPDRQGRAWRRADRIVGASPPDCETTHSRSIPTEPDSSLALRGSPSAASFGAGFIST